MASTIKFDIPASARSFRPFSRLPPEIRHQIWEDAILEPGMHFLRLDTAARVAHLPSPLTTFPTIDNLNGDRSDPLLDFAREQIPSKLWPATLEPRYPTPQANLSSYVTLNRTLAKLSVTCFEAASVVRRLINQPRGLKLNGGRIVSLASSNDIVCLEYLSAENFRSWCRMSLDIECPALANIRHVAIPYCHGWEAASTAFRCSHCGNQNGAGVSKVYPVHLYEFLARHLPNLQTFYFIDYLIVKKNLGVDPTAVKSQRIDSSSTEALTPDKDSAADKSDKRKKEDATDDSPLANKATELAELLDDGSDVASPETNLSSTGSEKKQPGQTFRSEGRVFCELDEDQWNVKSRVIDTLSWIQKRFILYATCSKLSKHAHPQDVKFKVLACEWADREADAPPKLKRAAPAAKRSLPKRMRPLSKRSLRGRPLPIKSATAHSTACSSSSSSIRVSPTVKDHFEFVFGQQSKRDFGLSMDATS